METITPWLENQWVRLVERWPELWQATLETVYMVSVSTVIALLLGFALAIFMILTNPNGIKPNRTVYGALDWIVNTTRSFPFMILLIVLQPMTRALIGISIGTTATIVPLSIGAAPLAARLIEASFLEVDRGVIEAARSFGSSNMTIILKVLVPEALPSIVLNVAVLAITLLGYSAMAGTVGGGGLGDMAIKYGYHRFQPALMFYCVVILLVMVQVMQSVGNSMYKRLR
jgi:ABC-type metal ion transport system, permease component